MHVSKENPVALINYQVEMIFNNPREFIVPFDVLQQDDDLKLSYDISTFQTLTENMRSSNITLYTLITLFIDITNTLIECQQYFLDMSHFILDENFIFVKQGQERLSMIYLPFQFEASAPEKSKQFFTKLLYENLLLSTASERTIATNINNYIKENEIFTQDFNRFLHKQRNEISDNNNHSDLALQTPTPTEQKISGSKLNKKQSSKGLRPFDHKMVFFFVLCQLIIIGLAFLIQLICHFYHLDEKKNILIVLFVFVSDLLVVKGLKSYLRASLSVCTSENKRQCVEIKDALNTPISEHDKSNYKSIEETVLLYDQFNPKGYLVFDQPNIMLPYCLDKPNTAIGRNALFSDITLQDRVIGRVHAEIITREDAYYLVDKKSKNSTYLNDERILPDSERKLHHLDKIVFGNIPCTFVMK